MEKITLLSRQRHADRQRNKSAPTPAEQVSRLTHAVMNQLTIIYLSCAKLRRGLSLQASANQECEILNIEAAVEQVAKRVEAFRFRSEKPTRARGRCQSGKAHKQRRAEKNLSFISLRPIDKS